jgi:hypothetical protein
LLIGEAWRNLVRNRGIDPAKLRANAGKSNRLQYDTAIGLCFYFTDGAENNITLKNGQTVYFGVLKSLTGKGRTRHQGGTGYRAGSLFSVWFRYFLRFHGKLHLWVGFMG